MTASSGGENSAGAPSGSRRPSKRNLWVIVIIIVGLVVVAVYAWQQGPAAPSTGTPTSTPIPPVSEIKAPPTVTSIPTTKAERLNVGSTSVLVPAGLLVHENDSLKQLFTQAGVELFAARSIGNTNFDEMNAKIQNGETTLPEALKTYWRVDILELGNPQLQDLTAWITTYWPPYDSPTIEVTKSERKLDARNVTVHALKHNDIGMLQSIYFVQPKTKGNVVILSSFQGLDKQFQKDVDALLNSAKFN